MFVLEVLFQGLEQISRCHRFVMKCPTPASVRHPISSASPSRTRNVVIDDEYGLPHCRPVLWRVGNRMIPLAPLSERLRSGMQQELQGNPAVRIPRKRPLPSGAALHVRQTESPNPIRCDSVVKKLRKPDQSVLRPRDAIVSRDHPGDKGFSSRRRNMVSVRGRAGTELMPSTAITEVASKPRRRST